MTLYLKFVVSILLANIVAISCKQYGSLSLVIDDTASMRNEIDSVKNESNAFMDIILQNNSSQISDVVIVTFGDPEDKTTVRLHQNKDRKKFRDALDGISVDGGDDCPEYSLSGIKKALNEGKPNSYVFVFTDASPKDGYVKQKRFRYPRLDQNVQSKKLRELEQLAQEKRSQIFFFITPSADCHEPSHLFKPYWNIATATSGQVFKITKKTDLRKFLDYLKIVISGEGDKTTRVIPPNKSEAIKFKVDDQTGYFMVSASSSGNHVDLHVTGGPTRTYDQVVWTDNNKILKVNNPLAGEYEVTAKGSSETTVTVFKRTDFTFEHAFADTTPPTFINERPLLIDGIEYVLLVKVSDSSKNVNIKTAQIESTDGKRIYKTLNLKKVSDDYYTADSFLPPQSTLFVVTIIGEGKNTGEIIKRSAKTPSQTRNIDTVPVITIHGDSQYKYNSTVVLTCDVKAHPKPKSITWSNSKRIPFQDLYLKQNNLTEYETKIMIKNFKTEARFYCIVDYKEKMYRRSIDLQPITPFIVDEGTSQANKIVEFGSSVDLYCNITSHLPMKIDWYYVSGYKDVKSSSDFIVSNNGRKITVNKVKEDTAGEYVCQATLIEDEETRYQLQRSIGIKKLPPHMGNPANVNVKENETISIRCNILKGYPTPNITWQFREYGNQTFQPLSHIGNVLTIHKANYHAAGFYKCIATNIMGSGEHETTVTVKLSPKITLLINHKEVTNIDVEYADENNTLLSCEVLSHPSSRPQILWFNEKNEEIPTTNGFSFGYFHSSVLPISKLVRSEKYYCKATNEIGTTRSNYLSINVNSPFTVDHSNDNIAKVKYAERAFIKCGITSRLPIKRTWQKDMGELEKGSNNYSLLEDGAILKINHVGLHTQGKYTCKASIINDQEIQVTHVTTVEIIREQPRLAKNADVKVFRNETVVLKCKVTNGFPIPTTTWMRKTEKDKEFTACESKTGGELIIRLAQYQDTGVYKCVAKNDIGVAEETVNLSVQGPPVITTATGEIYTAVAGDVALRIPCAAIGNPKPFISWASGSYDVRRMKTSSDGSLIIKDPVAEDSKIYTCTATNTFGSVEQYFEASVSETLENIGDEADVNVLFGKTINLNCSDESSEGRWFKSDQPMGITGTLTLVDVTENDIGNYTCRLSNEFGSKSVTYNVFVGYPPTFRDPRNEKRDWDGVGNIPLSCVLERDSKDPTLKATWYYNGKVSNESQSEAADKSSHPIISWGEYICNISNYHGHVVKHFTVYSSACLIKLHSTVTKSPLVLNSLGSWLEKKKLGRHLSIKSNEEVLLSCHNQPIKPNVFQNLPDKSEIIATCDHEDKFRVDGKIYSLSDLQCNSEVTPALLETEEQCAYENTKKVTIGYNVQTSMPHFLEVYTVCFDKSNKAPVYTKMDTTEYDLEDIKPMWQRYEKYYNRESRNFCVQDNQCCLDKVQLVNQSDVVQEPVKYATFIDGLNTVLYWRGCEDTSISDSWATIGHNIRKKVRTSKLLSGAHDYNNRNGTLVPKYLWKIFVTPGRTMRIIVKVNDPNPTGIDIPCNKIDCRLSWLNYKNIYCCKLEDFKEKFNLPNLDV